VIDPLISALFGKLPAPDSVWAEVDRERWLKAMELSLTIVYGEPLPEAPPKLFANLDEPIPNPAGKPE
jgi:hypothetical protein